MVNLSSSNCFHALSYVIMIHNDDKFIDIIFIDFKKPFDKVSHPEFLLKLKAIVISGNVLSLIHYFSYNRIQCGKVNLRYSCLSWIESGFHSTQSLDYVWYYINNLTNLFKDRIDTIELFADYFKLHMF